MAKIMITMLGSFTISYKDKVLDESDKRGGKMRLLLQYLIAHRDRDISQNELIELLWPDSNNPAGALKTLTHRTRAKLAEVLPEGTEMILNNYGSYKFNKDLDCFIDSGEFAKLCEQADNEALSRTKRVHIYKEALKLYSGSYLNASSDNTWVLPINAYFHTLYTSAVEKCVKLLIPMGKFTEIVKICEKAMIIDPFDEKTHEHLIRAMVALGEYSLAAKQYEYIRKLLQEQFGSAPSARLTDLYELTVKSRSDTQMNMDTIIGELVEDDLPNGGYYCEYEVFKYIFRLYNRESIRNKTALSLYLITVAGKNGEELTDIKQLDKHMQKLSDSISASLRMRDVYTKYSRCQFIILLPDADGSSDLSIRSRIIKKFQRYQNKMELSLKFDFRDLLENSI